MSEALKNMTKKARDNGRTPVQWDDSANAGFTTGVPWTRIHDDYKLWNAKNQVSDPTSVWSFWKALLVLRKQNLVLVYGSFKHVSFEHEHIFVRPFPFFLFSFSLASSTHTVNENDILTRTLLATAVIHSYLERRSSIGRHQLLRFDAFFLSRQR